MCAQTSLRACMGWKCNCMGVDRDSYARLSLRLASYRPCRSAMAGGERPRATRPPPAPPLPPRRVPPDGHTSCRPSDHTPELVARAAPAATPVSPAPQPPPRIIGVVAVGRLRNAPQPPRREPTGHVRTHASLVPAPGQSSPAAVAPAAAASRGPVPAPPTAPTSASPLPGWRKAPQRPAGTSADLQSTRRERALRLAAAALDESSSAPKAVREDAARPPAASAVSAAAAVPSSGMRFGVTVDPTELRFAIELNRSARQQLRVRAPASADGGVTFKVRASDPKRYSTRPAVGIVYPGFDALVTVRLVPFVVAPGPCTDKLQIRKPRHGPNAAAPRGRI